MITALIIMHLFGGGTLEIFPRSDFKAVGRAIDDVERAAAVVQIMERMNERLASVLDMRSEYFEQLSKIDHSVTSRESAYDKIIDELWKSRAKARKEHIEDVFKLREHITRNEWNAAFGGTE